MADIACQPTLHVLLLLQAGLCQNVRNVTWFDKIDADSFYPRSYRLDEITDRSDFIGAYTHSEIITVRVTYSGHLKKDLIQTISVSFEHNACLY